MKKIIISENQFDTLFCEGRQWNYGEPGSIPKYINDIIGKYCSERSFIEAKRNESDKINREIAECQEEYENYRQTGKVSPEFMEMLFKFYMDMLKMSVSFKSQTMDNRELDGYAEILVSRGFDLDELYNQYKQNN